ncbi:hypothetical protein ACI65C_004505 [Semiaphis heraclei]
MNMRCEIWLERCQLPVDTLSQKNVKLCGKHFEKIMFLNFLENRLKTDAIPTLFSDNCDVSTTDLSSEKVKTCTSSSITVFYGSNTPLNISDDLVTYDNNEILTLPLPGSPEVSESNDYTISPGTSSFSNEKSAYLFQISQVPVIMSSSDEISVIYWVSRSPSPTSSHQTSPQPRGVRSRMVSFRTPLPVVPRHDRVDRSPIQIGQLEDHFGNEGTVNVASNKDMNPMQKHVNEYLP